MGISSWISNNFIEIFGAVTGIIYVFLEIRQTIWLWPVGIVTSAVYIWVFFTGKIYADMSLQVYYLAISILGWYWWVKGTHARRSFSEDGGRRAKGSVQTANVPLNNTPFRGKGAKTSGIGENKFRDSMRAEDTEKKEKVHEELQVTKLKLKTGLVLALVFILLYITMYLILTRLTDSPVPLRDSFITSLSIIATWMLARKIYEHWYLWIVVNFVSAVLFLTRGLYPTVILYVIYGIMSFVGLVEWKKTINFKY
jgi:nicotinamide mononucleotide transporter